MNPPSVGQLSRFYSLTAMAAKVRRPVAPLCRLYSTPQYKGTTPGNKLAPKVKKYVEDMAKLCNPDAIHVCDGSDAENASLVKTMVQDGQMKKLAKMDNCWLTRTDPKDTARVESKTWISTANKNDTVPYAKESQVSGDFGNWMSPGDLEREVRHRFPGTMKGRTMYVMPYSMGPVGSPLSKIGVQVTDSPYVVSSMRIMTRMGANVLTALGNGDFVKCLHSVGRPLPLKEPLVSNWPCVPDKTMIAHIPAENEIISFGSGYGGNSLLGKKCFALRIGSTLARREGWLAEHMLILSVTNPKGQKKYVCAAFPSACGKTNLAMMMPKLPGYEIKTVGDDIAWLRFDETGTLRAINPEAGFFGVAPGTSYKTNPIAMDTIMKNTVFTNVAETSDGGIYWEGIDEKFGKGVSIIDWKGRPWKQGSKEPAAHPNSRFCTPAAQCTIMDSEWESPRGVPISAIIFGGRRPEGVPLVFETLDWAHGVFVGASMRSETTAAAEFKGKAIMHDPMAMRPFLGYNFGHYLQHWLSLSKNPKNKMPKMFHVNWFRKDAKGNFMWPGYGENSRVLDWICRRVDGENCADKSPIGYVPKRDALNLSGMKDKVDMAALFDVPKDFWLKEVADLKKYFAQVGKDLPSEIGRQLEALEQRVRAK